MSNKDLVIETVRKLPEEVTIEEICEEIAMLAAIRRGEQAADEGRVISHEEVKRKVSDLLPRQRADPAR
jgi:predicted transcriptional regulator